MDRRDALKGMASLLALPFVGKIPVAETTPVAPALPMMPVATSGYLQTATAQLSAVGPVMRASDYQTWMDSRGLYVTSTQSTAVIHLDS